MSALGQRPGEWQAIHIFYAANPRPLLTQCIDPLVSGLVTDGLLSTYYFVHYWLEGPHVRLRLKPRTEADTAKVRARAETAVAAFLEGRPTLYEVKPEFLVDFYETVFQLDYSAAQRERLLEPDGTLRLRRNNTYGFEPYEPEYARYGGPAGVELAEWHFRHSSELTLEVCRNVDPRSRTVLMGLSAQLMMVMTTAFLRDDEAVADFFQRYHDFWRRTFAVVGQPQDLGHDRVYDLLAVDIPRRFTQIRRALEESGSGSLPGFLRSWAEHCSELRERAFDLAARGDLVFTSWDPAREEREGKPADPATALELLLAPYLRMTNNRLNVPMREEARLSYVLARSLHERLAMEAGA
ncbi:lantibiotic dehydratase C-terminal domain-containing protein [Wenjunlia tyrosinilytica]|uniref:Lantibiotic biosynthesis protein n=1 Tax=Wenjunlia tyrosinilytica TaxID=1544741 RepID=A0A917ZRZ1_9ACTN|nr:lantibiotic dehydratase C-terminal domain-containing protein [Wenjunlia tyrosinilytica]GGO89059.1 lantibiotic biosynthesis protein [Wenjunlia tyrosinilytica]